MKSSLFKEEKSEEFKEEVGSLVVIDNKHFAFGRKGKLEIRNLDFSLHKIISHNL